jgi:hypothetical protein
MSELFQEYRGSSPSRRTQVAAAAELTKNNIKQLAAITGWTAVAHKVRGGSMVLSELVGAGMSAHLGDYVVSPEPNNYIALPKDWFEEHFELKGPLRVPQTPRT